MIPNLLHQTHHLSDPQRTQIVTSANCISAIVSKVEVDGTQDPQDALLALRQSTASQDQLGERVHNLHFRRYVRAYVIRTISIADVLCWGAFIFLRCVHALSMAEALIIFSPISGNFSQIKPKSPLFRPKNGRIDTFLA
ncbi:MAG: hypothetical protein AAGI24_08060 [Pseudomonadota bacterium]